MLERRLEHPLPSPSAIGAVLVRHGLVQARKRRQRHQPTPTTLSEASAPNQVWCIDYKGQFRLVDGTYCYPLTLTDQFSRYILGCHGMAAISDEDAREACHEAFACHGLPAVIPRRMAATSACIEPGAGIGQVALSSALSGELVGIREERDGRWLVNFCGVDLGHAGPRRKSFTPATSTTPSDSASDSP